MALKPVAGTKIRGGKYHLKLRIPAAVQAAYGGKVHLERSLKTADPQEAARKVRAAQVELDEAVERAAGKDTLAQAVAALPADQQALYREAGSLQALLAQWQRTATARAFMEAGGALTASELQNAESTTGEREIARASHQAEMAALDRVAAAEQTALHALGADVPAPLTGLRGLLTAYVEAKGIGDQTAATMGAIVDRFVQHHGNVPLPELTKTHLREYAEAAKGLPAVTSSKQLRGKPMAELLRIAAAKGLPTITHKTVERHVSMLKALTAFAPGQGYMESDPWRDYKLIAPKVKHSARQATRVPFDAEQAQAVLDATAILNPGTIDRWAPLLAAYQGARREEIGQLRGCDVFEDGGVWAMRITDEGTDQKVKNAASFRTIPLHQTLLDAGFHTFAKTRPADAFIFREEKQHQATLQDLRPDARGRLTEPYGKRFSRLLRKGLDITDTRVTFHSFRHLWEDAAEDAQMPQTHRRDLAGRSRAGDSQAGYGNGPKLAALKVSLDMIKPI